MEWKPYFGIIELFQSGAAESATLVLREHAECEIIVVVPANGTDYHKRYHYPPKEFFGAAEQRGEAGFIMNMLIPKTDNIRNGLVIDDEFVSGWVSFFEFRHEALDEYAAYKRFLKDNEKQIAQYKILHEKFRNSRIKGLY